MRKDIKYTNTHTGYTDQTYHGAGFTFWEDIPKEFDMPTAISDTIKLITETNGSQMLHAEIVENNQQFRLKTTNGSYICTVIEEAA